MSHASDERGVFTMNVVFHAVAGAALVPSKVPLVVPKATAGLWPVEHALELRGAKAVCQSLASSKRLLDTSVLPDPLRDCRKRRWVDARHVHSIQQPDLPYVLVVALAAMEIPER
jgi:hypothetical protein